MKPEIANQPTAELVKLAQRELHGDSVLSDDAGFARLQARQLTARKSVWSRGWLAGGVALASAGALALALAWPAPSRALTFEVAGGSLGASGHVVAKEGTRIRFSDGSEASLSNGTEAQVTNVTEHGADVVLQRGSMRVSIAKKPEAAWKVAAGPYDVRVTGTAFDVSWSTQEQTFDLRMQTGAVIVTGPLAQNGIVLKAGQHLFGGVAEGRLTVEGGESAAPAEPPVAVAAPLPEPEPQPVAPNNPTPAGLGPSPRSPAEPHAWTKQVAQGHFADVLNEAEQRGLSRTLDSGSLEELSALADAARYAGRSGVAKRVLLAERQRFPNSAAARDAAFFLGRIAEDGGGGSAVEWYERYVAESPRGAYASQALGRKMMLLYKQRGVATAKPVAADYLARYPNGPYAAAARKIEQESPSAKLP
jgi:TolA-binding protein